MPDFRDAIHAEISALREAIRARMQKIDALENVLALYANGVPEGQSVAKSEGALEPKPRAPRPGSEARIRAVQLIKELLADREEPAPTRELYDFVTSQGVVIGGEKPQNNLSAMLYNSKEFLSHGRAGWTLPRDGEPVDNGPSDGTPVVEMEEEGFGKPIDEVEGHERQKGDDDF